MNREFKKGIILAILSVIGVAIFDILAMKSGIFGNLEAYTTGNFGVDGWWNLYYSFNLIFLATVPIAYFIFARRDKSESISLYLTSLALFWAGLADLFYFWFRGEGVPQILPWLNGSPIIGKVSLLIGNTDVTSTALYLSVGLGFVFIVYLNKFMEKIN